jgi:hypothetical protein
MSVFAPVNNYDPINYALTYYKNRLKGKSNPEALAAAEEEATKKDPSAAYDVMLGGSFMKTAGVIAGFVAGTIGIIVVSRSCARKKEKEDLNITLKGTEYLTVLYNYLQDIKGRRENYNESYDVCTSPIVTKSPEEKRILKAPIDELMAREIARVVLKRIEEGRSPLDYTSLTSEQAEKIMNLTGEQQEKVMEGAVNYLAGKILEKHTKGEDEYNSLYDLLSPEEKEQYDSYCQAKKLKHLKYTPLFTIDLGVSKEEIKKAIDFGIENFFKKEAEEKVSKPLISEPSVYLWTITPNSGRVGQTLTITFKGVFLNVYANGNYVEGFAITFGDLGDAALQTPTLDEKGTVVSLPVTLTIPQNAKPGVRDISIKIGENILATIKDAFKVVGGIQPPRPEKPDESVSGRDIF